MEYWDMMVNEVIGEQSGQYKFSVTNVRLYKHTHKPRAAKTIERVVDKGIEPIEEKEAPEKKRYYLGENFPDAYFTQMELNTLMYVFTGESMTQIGHKLSLSRRTIEYHIKNMKTKLRCKYRGELMAKVLNSDLVALIKKPV